MKLRSRVRTAVLVVSLAGQSAGCMGWLAEESNPVELVAQKHPTRVRVAWATGMTTIAWNPEIVGDSLRFTLSRDGGPWRAAPLSQIVSLATWQIDPLRTAGLIALGGAAIAMTAAVATFDPGPW